MTQLFTPNLVLILTLATGLANLFTPLTSRLDRVRRTVLVLFVSCLFFLNVIFLDFLFFDGVHSYIEIFTIGKFKIAFNLEPLGLIFLNLIALLWIFALMYTIKFLVVNQMEHSRRFLFFMNASVFCGVFVALSANLFTMFIGYEMLTISTIPLIAHKISDNVREGLLNYLQILMLSALILFMPAMIVIYAEVGHGDFILGGIIDGNFSNASAIILLLMFIFGISKAALFPLHNWLPSAMVASYPVSALLHAVVVVKTGLFCIYKIMIYVFGLSYLQSLFVDCNWLIVFPIITIIYSSVQALRFNEIKMILAYSTINQLSIALLSAFMLSQKAMAAAILHMISHSFTKICLFYAAGNIYSLKKTYHINQLTGASQDLPKTSFVFFIAALSLIGIPPFAGFFSKFYILIAAVEQENFLVVAILILSTIFTAVYVSKMLSYMYKPIEADLENNTKPQTEKTLPKLMLISLFCCLTCVVLFIFIQRIIYKFLVFI